MTDKPSQTPAQARVAAFLAEELPPGSAALSAEIKARAEAAHISWRSVQRYSKACGVVIDEAVTPNGRATWWTRPAAPKPLAAEPDSDRQGVPVRQGRLGDQARALLARGRYERSDR